MKKDFVEVFLVFFILVLISPWFYIGLANKGYFYNFNKPQLTFSQVEDEVNKFQGEGNRVGVPFTRLVVNKYSMMFRQSVKRYLESYDPRFLFFVGGLEYKNSIRQSGVIFLGFLPLILYAVYMSFNLWSNKKRLTFYSALFLSPIPSVFLSGHYDVLAKIGFLLALTYLAAEGFMLTNKKHRIIWFIITFFILLELINFYHNFYLHYPMEFEKEVFGIWKDK